MTRVFGLALSLCAAIFAGSPAQAVQKSSAVAASELTPGTKVYDVDGKEVGTVAKVSGDKIAVAIEGNGLIVPRAAFVRTDKGPALKATKAKIFAVLHEAERDAAAVDAALKVGAEVRSADGAAVLGKIKDILAANIDDQGRIDLDAIFANPIYSRLLGRFEEINKLFEGRLRDVFGQLSIVSKLSA